MVATKPAPTATLPVRAPRYLRVVVTRACPLRCAYCHAEGEHGAVRQQPTVAERAAIVAVELGVRKVKFLGGEPLVDQSLPALVRAIRADHPAVDLSVITSAVVSPERVDEVLAAGLDRINVSIHGFSPAALSRRGVGARAHATREQTLDRVIGHGRPLKLNTVYAGPEDEPDLAELLAWAAGRPLVVNVLDDLDRDLSIDDLLAAVRRLRGLEASLDVDVDPNSLDTLHLRWADGLRVEIKHQRLGELAPWTACAACPLRARCREGIHAMRLSADGDLRLCMDRDDLRLPALELLRERGVAGLRAEWTRWMTEVCR
jgi:cyclic pyranopterin phosphate synthase